MGSAPIPCEAVLFDLDNTLYEYAPCNAAGLLAAEQVLATQCSLGEGRFQELHDIVRLELAEELKGSAASHERSLFFKRIAERSMAPENRGSHPGLAVHMFEAYWGAFMGCMEPAPHAHEQLSLLAGTHRLPRLSIMYPARGNMTISTDAEALTTRPMLAVSSPILSPQSGIRSWRLDLKIVRHKTANPAVANICICLRRRSGTTLMRPGLFSSSTDF